MEMSMLTMVRHYVERRLLRGAPHCVTRKAPRTKMIDGGVQSWALLRRRTSVRQVALVLSAEGGELPGLQRGKAPGLGGWRSAAQQHCDCYNDGPHAVNLLSSGE